MKKLIIFMVLLLTLSGCVKTDEKVKEPINYEESVTSDKQAIYYVNTIADKDGNMVIPMYTNCGIITSDANKSKAMQETFENDIVYYHKILDPNNEFDNINNIKTINDNYGKGPIVVDKELIEIVKEAVNLTKLTRGYFNFTVGTLSDVWKEKFNYEHVNTDPEQTIIEEAKNCSINYEDIEKYIVIDEENSTIELKELENCPYQVKLDLGAFSKGYVLDKITNDLKQYKCGFLITAGGSSIVTYKQDSQEKLFWTIGQNNPNNTNMSLFTYKSGTMFISTSGDYEQYFINENGIRRHHILNPYTGYPDNTYRAICLVADKDAGILDGLTTALFSAPSDIQEQIISDVENYYDLSILKAFVKEDLDNNLILTIDNDFTSIVTGYNINAKYITTK